MTQLQKLTFKTVENTGKQKDPVWERRNKLTTAIDEQHRLHAAKLKGEDYTVERSKWLTDDTGERVETKTQRRVNPWFFEQDGGWYIQCRYGARVLLPNGKDNAVFVRKLEDVAGVLNAFREAAQAGELDAAIARAMETKKKAA
ncbi:MAG: hypothetical protein NXI16_16480 [Alphaproteobacteria bacterium]|nr:hypothetical protein [Alphaproteobacteria bacterium]